MWQSPDRKSPVLIEVRNFDVSKHIVKLEFKLIPTRWDGDDLRSKRLFEFKFNFEFKFKFKFCLLGEAGAQVDALPTKRCSLFRTRS